MNRCAFLTMEQLDDFFVYDDLVKPYLNELGWQTDDISWHDVNTDYDDYDVVVVRSTWDYQAYPEAFLSCLKKIEASSANLQNPLKLMQWNFSKDYLRDLEMNGVAILPTLWRDKFILSETLEAFETFNTDQIIIKPRVSANADFTYRLTLEDLHTQANKIESELNERSIMIQAFEKNVLAQGEYSLFYFASEYSHTIVKRPAIGDFRVQEEHGGQMHTIEPSAEMLLLAKQTLKALPEESLYARIDMLNTSLGMAIIEVELIEPSLYFNLDPVSPERFAKALVQQYQSSAKNI
ncbi:ATP-grasp domain-containing protein [Glaciecola petra]|uniref:Prokaryotic glutathione synthetase ATP-binding domain-containing protein n=1 Tax=Glaciecola petra TaxID=3075602 RepID=A0ABU2ZSS8_9ALTE|nr:hypothetical protein [Aestuariibacter sp. P117]MDT0595694.1 hypothetical protein [Aestuariibacter sp. P117]